MHFCAVGRLPLSQLRHARLSLRENRSPGGVPAAGTLLEAGMVAVGHFCTQEGGAPVRWMASVEEA